MLAFAKHQPKEIYFTGRDSGRAAAVINDIKSTIPDAKIIFLECDFTSLASVQEAAHKFTSESPRLDILMCNAGVMALPPGLTKDGYEIQFGTNHLGHALLTKMLLPTLLRTAEAPNADVRIVFLTSIGFRAHPKRGIQFEGLRTTQDFGVAGQWIRYGQSKLANILYAAELARRYPNITTVSIHPGVINTGLVENLGFLNKALVYITNLGSMKTPVEGTWNQLWAATANKETIINGEFYEPVAVLGKHGKESNNKELACELWDWTQRELEKYEI